MKKFTLLLCVFVVSVMMPQSVVADPTVVNATNLTITINGSSLTVTSTKAGALSSFMASNSSTIGQMRVCTSLALVGKFKVADLTSIQLSGDNFKFTEVDMSRAKFPTETAGEYLLYTTKPSEPANGKKYVVGGTYYKSEKSYVIAELDANNLPVTDENGNYTTRDDYCHLQIKEFVNSAHRYKLKHAVFYRFLGNIYVENVNGSSSGINYEAIDNIESATNAHVKINTGTQENPTWKYYDKTPQCLPIDESILSSGSTYTFKNDWTTADYLSKDFGSLTVGNIFGVWDNTYIYYDAVEHFEWVPQSSYTNGNVAENYYSNLYDAKAATEENKYIVVGGTLYLYNNDNWTEIPAENDWKGIQFGKWGNSILTAIIPTEIYSTDLDQNNLWTNDKCVVLTEVRSGLTVATITQDGDNRSVALNVAKNSDEYARMKAILQLNSYVGDNNFSASVISDGLSNDIYTVVGAFSASTINDVSGTVKVLDLKNATSGVTQDNLKELKNRESQDIEYIILPAKLTKEFVCDSTTYYKAKDEKIISTLKAVISSDEENLVAHVLEPGTLAGARYYATGGKMNGESFMPTPMGLKSVTLSGNLNADDISTKGEISGLSGEMHTIESMDLEKAYFPNNNDMNFLEAGFQGGHNDNCHLSKISLPIDERMKHIPVDCFRNLKSLDSLCIPFNYQYIHNGALYDSNVEHLTTTDSIGGAVIDNGPLTYTLSANLLEIGDAPSPKLNGDGIPQSVETYVFPKENGVLEIYSRATRVPKCYRYSFSYDLTFGYGGQDQTKVYGRNRFFNNGEGKKSFVVLRYPSKEVFVRRKNKGKPVELPDGSDDAGYALMEKKYTDVTKVYTKKDQTGAIDANGNPMLWPARTEGNRAHNQATVGALWDDWGKSYNGENGSEINDGEDGISSGSRSMTRRRDESADVYEIDLSVGTSTTGVKTNAYTFKPTEDWTRMLQYYNLSRSYDGITYDKIVVNYSATSDHFHVYADEVINLPSSQNSIKISLSKDALDEFTIYNSDPEYNWSTNTEERKITINEIYFTTTGDNPKRLYLSLTNGKTPSVVRNRVGENYTFQPIGNVRNMFQYKPLSMPNDGKTYKKLVVEFEEAVPKGFNIHAYGERGEFYSLEDKTSYEIPLNGNQIEDFTIFNWDDAYWTEKLLSTSNVDTRKVVVKRAYFTTDNYDMPVVTQSKYKHDKVDNDDKTFDLVDYIGWHQIVLTQPVYYEPVVKKEGETIKRNYKKTGYSTFCIPYDLTYSQLVKMMGIPASAGNVENYNEKNELVSADSLPDIRQLISVTRKKGSTNQIIYRLSENLAKDKTDVKYLDIIGENGDTLDAPIYKSAKYRYRIKPDGTRDELKPADADPRCIVGGRPYIIDAYIPANDSLTMHNLGMYIMTRYADELSDTASCVNNGKDYYEQLATYTESGTGDSKKVVADSLNALTMRFAKPYEGHLVRAYFDDEENPGYLEYDKQYETGAKAVERKKYYYTMVGQFWEQDLPLYSIYMTRKGKWARYSTPQNFKWDRYKCVFFATPDVTSNNFVDSATVVQSLTPDAATQTKVAAEKQANQKVEYGVPCNYYSAFNHFGNGFRDIANCYFPMNFVGTFDWIPAPMTLSFFGRNDRDFGTQIVHKTPTSTRYILMLDNDDEIIEYDGEGEVTNVKTIDMLDGVPQLTGKSRVYNLSGQYMGNTTDGLPKGVYIVDGRKIVVE